MAQRYKVEADVELNWYSLYQYVEYLDDGEWTFQKNIQATNMEDAVDSAKNWIEWINQPAVEFEV